MINRSLQPVLLPLLSGLAIVTCCASLSGGDNWPGFQNGGAMSLPTGAAPAGVLETEPAWTADIHGYGQSSPVIWNEQAYVTSVDGDQKQTYFISAFRLDGGELVWQHGLPNATPAENSNYVSKAAPTPVADADGLICFFEGGNIVALTHAGKVRWERNLVTDYGEIAARHGLSASLEQDEDAVYVWVERSEEPYVLSLDKQTGETNWKVPGLGVTSWASPRLVTVAGGRHLVLSGIGSLVGLDPATGERLWQFDQVSGNSTPTPVPLGEGRFLIGATIGRGGEAGEGRAAESNGVVAITQTGDGAWQAGYLWRAKRATSSFGSPIAHAGRVYFVNRTGVLYGLDAATGEEQFARRLSGSIWATPLGLGKRIFFFGKDGNVDVLAAEGDTQQVNTWNSLPKDPAPASTEGEGPPAGGSVLYAAALADGMILLRRGDQLFAYRLSTQSE